MSTDHKSAEAKKLGEYLLVSDGTIKNLIEKRKIRTTDEFGGKRIGELLMDAGVLTQEELDNSIRQQRIARLLTCPVFASLSSIEVAALSRVFTEVSYPPQTTFITQGDKDPSLYIIASGLVEVFQVNDAGKHIHIAVVGAGAPIGEMGYFSDGIRAACVRTLKTTHLLQAQYEDLTKYFERAQRVALAFMRVVQQRKIEMSAQIAEDRRREEEEEDLT